MALPHPHTPPPPGELKPLLTLAWPVVVGQLGIMLMGVVDTMMVGQLGEAPLAAIALAHTWSMGVTVVALGTAAGLDPVLAQAFGAGDRTGAGRTLLRGALLLTVLAVPVMALHYLAGPGLRLLGQPEALLPTADAYCRVVAWATIPLLLFAALRQFLQGAGLMRPAMVVILVANLLNVGANWVLIHGHLGMPALGAVGSAWATVISRTFMLALLLVFAAGLLRACWPGLAGVADLRALKRLAGIGVPVGVQVGTELWAFTAATLMVGWLGQRAVAAHIVALNLASLAFMVPLGISAAAATRVGNLLGAGMPWRRAAWTAVGVGCGVMALSALLFATLPEPLARLYSRDAAVVTLAASLLPIAAAFQLFDGTQAVCFGVLRGAGDTRVPALANVVGFWCLGLPFGAWLAFAQGWGPHGIWVGLTVGLAVTALLLLARLRSTMARGGYRVAA